MNARKIRFIGTLLLIGLLYALPFVLDETWVGIVTKWIPLAIAALGLNLLTGYNGQVSLGQGAFFGAGAYASALVVNHYDGNFLLGIAAGGAFAFLAGIIIGIPALRIRGLALALMTLAFAALFPFLLKMFDSVTNAPRDLKITSPQPNPRDPSRTLDRLVEFRSPFEVDVIADDQWRYLYVLTVAVVCFVLVRNLINSRIGRAIVAIRDNEIAAATSGINISRVKLLTFGCASALGGIGGGLFAVAQDTPQLSANTFNFALSLRMLAMVVLGGPGTILGAAFGAGIDGFFEDGLKTRILDQDFQPAAPFILAVLMILSVNLSPGGIAGTARDALDRITLRGSKRGK